MAKRTYCNNCHYPTSTCVCDAIENIDLPIEILVIQHKNEAKHAKSTIKLAVLVTPSIEVISTSNEEHLIKRINQLDPATTVVLYPTQNSYALETINTNLNKISTMILLDGTWKQVYGMRRKYQVLNQFNCIHFNNPPQQQYDIRSSDKSYQLSSIEALAHAVKLTCGVNPSSYYKALERLKDNWLSHIKGAPSNKR